MWYCWVKFARKLIEQISFLLFINLALKYLHYIVQRYVSFLYRWSSNQPQRWSLFIIADLPHVGLHHLHIEDQLHKFLNLLMQSRSVLRQVLIYLLQFLLLQLLVIIITHLDHFIPSVIQFSLCLGVVLPNRFFFGQRAVLVDLSVHSDSSPSAEEIVF